jgi:hypothetical protein
MWQQELGPSCLPEIIVQIFQEVRTRPLVNLLEFPKFMSPWQVPMNLDPEDADKRVWEIPDGLLERLDVPKAACLEYRRPNSKGACQLLVTVFQREISSCWSADFIIQLFREIRARPLEDLSISYPMPLGGSGEEDDSESDSEDDMGICPRKFKELPDFLRVKLDLPTTYFGFALHVGTVTENGRRLIR